ncbi:hypothetical protein FHS03_001430 [Massilia violacea]|uniref:Uncharacterized protein n=1 Tax=Pseudoduganella violacea TaxID=1715466 RepID=A0A7W5FT21_9BURK|nr:hypothetical protein [Pseudoduganella violacea]
MMTLFTMGIFACMIGLIVFEIVAEGRGSHHKLLDRYHE